jgi:hypothetical protein
MHNPPINDQNSSYIGDGAYAHVDSFKRLWIFTYDGYSILNKICLENEVFESLCRFYKARILTDPENV